MDSQATLLSLEEIEGLTSDFLKASITTIPPPPTPLPLNPLNRTVAVLPTDTANVSQIVLSKQADETRKAMERVVSKFLEFSPSIVISEPNILQFLANISSSYAPSSLWSMYSLLKKYILWEWKVDLGEAPTIKQFLTTLNKTHKKKKAPAFTREQVYTFLSDLDTPVWMKLVVVIGIFGCMRSNEIVRISWEDIHTVPDGFNIDIVRIKTDRAFNGESVFIPALFNTPYNPVDFLAQYRAAIDPSLHTGRFFRNFQKGKYTKQPIGKNKISAIPQIVAETLGLPNPKAYTGHSLRVTGATLAADAGISITNLKRLGGWKSDSVVEGYLRDSKKLKTDNASLIAGRTVSLTPDINNNNNNNAPTVTNSHAFSFMNCNVTINVQK